jgi:hypothetical protein
MALLYPLKSRVSNRGQIYPGSIYSRPAIAPFYRGLRGFGQARRTSTQTFQDTLKSFATTPFAVNSQSYMDRIREEYGFQDEQLQNTLGTIGSIVGAGVTLGIETGVRKSLRGGLSFDPISTSRRKSVSGIFRPYNSNQIEKIINFNKLSDLRKSATTALNNADLAIKNAEIALQNAETLTKNAVNRKLRREAKRALDTATQQLADAKLYKTGTETILQATIKQSDEAVQAAVEAGVKKASKKLMESGGKLATKTSGLVPYVGLAADLASLGFSTAGLQQDVQAGDIGNTILSSIEVLGDAIAVAGDIVEYPLPGLGSFISTVGTLISAGISAIRIGSAVGETVGRSLSPSGLTAQGLFLQNLFANISARPVSTITAATIQFLTPVLLGSIARGFKPSRNKIVNAFSFAGNIILTPFRLGAGYLTEDALGNQIRSGLTMALSQQLTPKAAELDAKLPWYDPEGADFVSAISLFGDIQDNLYGATRNKAILLGLAAGDPQAKVDALARAWGYSDEPAYVLTAADIIEKVDKLKDAPNAVKSLLGVAGEILLDPRNYDEFLQKTVNKKRTVLVRDFIEREIKRIEVAKNLNTPDVSIDKGLDVLVGPNSLFKTREVLETAIREYNEKGKKGLEKYLNKVAISRFAGVQRDISAGTLSKQIDAFKLLLDEVNNGTYKSPIINNVNNVKLLEDIKKQKDIADYYVKNKKYPDGVTEDQGNTILRFIDLVQKRYGAQEADLIVAKLMDDFNAKPSIEQIQKYLTISDSFSSYMDNTDSINGALVKILNPLSALIQHVGVSGVQKYSELSRQRLLSPKKMAVTLTTFKKMNQNLAKIPTLDKEIKKALEDKSNQEKKLRDVLLGVINNTNLPPEAQILADAIKEEIDNNSDYDILVNQTTATKNKFATLGKNVDDALSAIDNDNREWKTMTIGYKTKSGVTITISEKTYLAEKDRYDKLQEKIKAGTPLTNVEKDLFNGLKFALLDYEVYIAGNTLFQQVYGAYKTVIQILNNVNNRLDDYMLDTISGMFAFRTYTNLYIPTNALKTFQSSLARLNHRLKSNQEKREENKAKREKAQEEIKAIESAWGTPEQKNIQRLQLLKDPQSRYFVLNKELADLLESDELTLKDDADTTAKIKVTEEKIKKTEAQLKAGIVKPSTVNAFDTDEHTRIMEALDELQKVQLINGSPLLKITYKDKDGKLITEDINTPVSRIIYKIDQLGGELVEVGINLKSSFKLEVNKLFNYYLKKDVFNVLSNYDHKQYDKYAEDWVKLKNEQQKRRLLVEYIVNSDLDQADKDKLLEPKMLRAIYEKLNTSLSARADNRFIPASELTPSIIYQYVMQENFKLYRGSADPLKSTNPIVKAFAEAAKVIQNIDTVLGDTEKFPPDIIEKLKERFEYNFKATPVYRYVKSFLFDYAKHDATKLSLFKRKSIEEILPKNLSANELKIAGYSMDKVNDIMNNFIEADAVQFVINNFDKEAIDNKINTTLTSKDVEAENDSTIENTREALENERQELKTKVLNDRILHEAEKEQAEEIAKDYKKDTLVETLGVDIDGDDLLPFTVRSQFQEDPKTLLTGVNNKDVATQLIVRSILNSTEDNPFILGQDYFVITLNMLKLIKQSDKSKPSFLSYLKSTGRSTLEYYENVNAFAYKVAWVLVKYSEYVSIEGIKVTSKFSVEDVQKLVAKKYLEDSKIEVKITNPDKKLQAKSNFSYTKYFRKVLINRTMYQLRKTNANVGPTEAIEYLKDLINNAKDESKAKLLNDLVNETHKEIGYRMRTNKDLAFLNTLSDHIKDLNDAEQAIKDSIEPVKAVTNPALRVRTLLESKEVRSILEELSQVTPRKDINSYNHVFFRLLHLANDYITEDYAGKKVLPDVDKFKEIVIKDEDLIFKMENGDEFSVFDLIYIHRINVQDYTNLVVMLLVKMSTRGTFDIAALRTKAITEYNNMLQQYGGFLSNSTLSISKEVFLAQGGTEKQYVILSNPMMLELSQRLGLLNVIFEKGVKDKKFDIQDYYDTRITGVVQHIEKSLLDPNTTKIVFTSKKMLSGEETSKISKIKEEIKVLELRSNEPGIKDQISAKNKEIASIEDRKVLFELDKTSAGKQRDVDTLLLLALIKIYNLKDSDVKNRIVDDQTIVPQSKIKQILRSIFFYDVKDAKGKSQDTWLDTYEERLNNQKKALVRYETDLSITKGERDYAIKRIKSRIRNYEAIIKFYTEINSNINLNPDNKFDNFFELITNPANEKLAETYFNSTYDTDREDRVLVKRKSTGKYVIVSKEKLSEYYKKNNISITTLDEGIPELNDYLINNVIDQNNEAFKQVILSRIKNNDNWKTFVNLYIITKIRKENNELPENKRLKEDSDEFKKLVEQAASNALRVVTEDGTAVVVVPDEFWLAAKGKKNEQNDSLKSIFNDKYKNHDIFDVFILSETKYKQVQDLHKRYFKTGEPYPMVSKFEVDDTVDALSEVINVKSKRTVVKVYINDLKLLSRQKEKGVNIVDTLKQLNEFYNVITPEIVPILQSYNEGINLFNTETFKQLQDSARTSLMLYEFYDLLGVNKNFDLEFVGRYFDKKYLNKDYDLETLKDEDPTATLKMKNHLINGSNMFDLLLNALKTMRQKYGDTDLSNVSFKNALRQSDLVELVKLKNLVYGTIARIERTNTTISKKIMPALRKHLNEAMAQEDRASLIVNELEGSRQYDSEFISVLKEVFNNPFKTNSREVIKLFDDISRKEIAQDIDLLTRQQFYKGIIRETSTTIKLNHRRRINNYKNQNLNYASYTSLRNIFRDYSERKISLSDFVKLVDKSINLDPALYQYFNGLAADIWKTKEQEVIKFGITSLEQLTQHLVYGYAIKSYLASIKQFMDRNVYSMSNMQNKGVFELILRRSLFKIINNKEAGQQEFENWAQQKSLPEKSKIDPTKYPGKEEQIRIILSALEKSTKRPDKSERYRINEQHYFYRGNSTQDLFEFKTIGTAAGKLTPAYAQDITISDYIRSYILNNFKYEIPESENEKIIDNTDLIIDTVTKALFESKGTLQYIAPVPEMPKEYISIQKIKEDLKADGFTDEEIDVVFKLSGRTDKPIVLNAGEEKAMQGILGGDQNKLDISNTYVNRIIDAKINNAKLNKLVKAKKRDVKEIIEINTIDVLNNSKRFLDYFVSILRGEVRLDDEVDMSLNERKSFKLIYNTFKFLGIDERMLERLLTGDYKHMTHFLNDYIKSTGNTDEAIKLANILMLFINYHKNEYIKRNFEQKANEIDTIKDVIDFETIRERSNTKDFIRLNVAGIFRTGTDTTNSLSYSLNRGFDIINSTASRIVFGDDRLGRIILDNTRRDTEYDSNYRSIYYKQNNVSKIAADIQHELYEPLFKKEDAGFIGSRKFQLLLEREGYSRDMIAENQAESYERVGSTNDVYNLIRKVFTEALKIIKIDFVPRQFIRVRDVAAAIQFFEIEKDTIGFYLDYYENKVIQVKQEYINKNLATGKTVEELENEFDARLNTAINNIVTTFGKKNLKDLDSNQVKAVLGLIFTQRFESEEYHTNANKAFEAFASKQYLNKVIQKQHKFRTVSEQVRRILESSMTDVQKKKELAVLQGKEKFEDLTKEEQDNINDALKRSKLIANNYFDTNRWYDTLAIARGEKALDAAETTMQGRLFLNIDNKINNKTRKIKGLERSLIRIKNNILNKDKQNALLTVDGNTPLHPHTYDLQQLINNISNAEQLLINKLSNLEIKLKDATAEFRKGNVNLIKEIFNVYPGLHRFYVQRATNDAKDVLAKLQESLKKLNDDTKKLVVEAYEAYVADLEKIEKITQSLEYKVMSIIGKPGTESAQVIFDIFKEELKDLVKDPAELKEIIDDAPAMFEQLKKLRDGLSAHGKNVAGYKIYVSAREKLNKEIKKQNDKILELSIGLINTENETSYADALSVLEDILKDYQEQRKLERSTLFKNVEEGNNVIQLTAGEKKFLLERYEGQYKGHHAYLRDSYKFIRDYNRRLGVVLPEVKIDENTRLDVLINAINKETTKLKEVLDNFENKKVNNNLIPAYKAETDLPEHKEFKNKLLYNIALELIVNYKSSVIGRPLTQAEIKAEQLDLNIRFAATDDTDQDILMKRKFIKDFIEFKGRFKPDKHDFGKTVISVDLNDIKDPLELRYASDYLNNLNHLIGTEYNKAINNTVESINKQLKNTDKNIEAIELSDRTVERLKNKNTISDKERTRKLFNNLFAGNNKILTDKVYLGKLSIDDMTLDGLIKLLISSNSNENINGIRKEIANNKKQLEQLQTTKNNINELPLKESEIESEKKSLVILAEGKDKAEKEFRSLLTKENTKHGAKDNNLDLFKAYYDLQGENNPQVILDKVLQLVVDNSSGWTVDQLKNYIKSRGMFELHNSIVDSLITYLNFLKQKGKEEVLVIDIETYKNNQDVYPYQITMIYRDKFGKLEINDVYINSAVFHDYEAQSDGKLVYGEKLEEFYQQQKDIWRKEQIRDGIVIDEIAFEKDSKTKMDTLVKRVQTVKNNSNFIEAFIRITNPVNKFKVVAHNGLNFDFAVLQNFVSTVGRNLIVNEYYRNIRDDLNLQKMYERIQSRADLTSDQKLSEYKKQLESKLLKHQEVLLREQNNLTFTKQDLKLVQESVDAILKEILKVSITIKLNEASRRVGYIVDDNIRERIIGKSVGVIKQLSNKIYTYLETNDAAKKDAIKNEIINRFMEGTDPYKNETDILKTVTEYVESLLKAVETSYLEYITGAKLIEFNRKPTSARTAASQAVYDDLDKKGIKVYDEDIKINIKEQLDRVEIGLDNLKRLKTMVLNGDSPETIATKLQEQKEKLTEKVKTLSERLKKLEDASLKISQQEVYESIHQSSIKIYKATRQYYGKLQKILDNIEATGFDTSLGTDYISTLVNQKNIIENNINNLLTGIQNIVEYIKTTSDTPELIAEKFEQFIDIRIIDVIKNPNKLEEIRQALLKELDVLKPSKDGSLVINDANKKIVNDLFNKIKEQHINVLKNTTKELNAILLKLNNVAGLNVKITEVDGKIFIDGQEMTLAVLKDFYENKLTADQALADANKNIFGTAIKLIKQYYRLTQFVAIKNAEELLSKKEDYKDTFYSIINNYRIGVEESLKFLTNYNASDKVKIQDQLIAGAYNYLLGQINLQEEVVSKIKETSILTLVTGQKPSSQMSNEEYRTIASTSLNIADITKTSERLKALNLGVYYDNPNKADPIQILRLVPNKVYGKKINIVSNNEDDDSENEGVATNDQYVFTVIDDIYNQSNSFRYDPSNDEVTFTFNYAYVMKPLMYTGGGEKGFEVEKKVITFKANDTEGMKRFIDTFYWKPGIVDDDIVIKPGIERNALHFEDGITDSGKNAIDTLKNFYIKNKSVFASKKDEADKKLAVEKLYNSKDVLNHENFSLNKDYVRVINITKRIETLFLNRIALLNSVERTPTKLREIYAGIYNSVTAKYKALEPDSIINQISSDYTIDYNLKKIDRQFLRQHNILLDLSSEGSAASVLKYRPKFAFLFPFIMNTNPVRTTLSFQHILAKYTTIGILNKMYADIIKEKGSIAPGKHLLNTFINETKYMTKGDIRNRIIRKSGKVNTQIFMPNVMTKELYNEYKADSIVHQFGATVPVSFVKDSRLPLDVIGIDADYARAMGWGDGDKTWLGLHYGFKGAVYFIPGLYDLYGSYFAARAESVVSRGTAGVYGEMLFNNIRAFLLNETDNTGQSILPAELKPLYEKIEPTLRKHFESLINKEDNVLIVDAKQVDELFEVINDALVNLPEFKGKNKNLLYEELIRQDLKGKKSNVVIPAYAEKKQLKIEDIEAGYDQNQNIERVFVDLNVDNGDHIRGYLYVFADNEHSAQSMQTITKVNTAGKLVLNIVDGNSSVTRGFMFSPTVLYAMLPKVGERIFEVFPPDDTRIRQLMEVKARGFTNYVKEALQIQDDEDFNLEEKLNQLGQLLLDDKIHPAISEYARTYLNLLDLSRKSSTENVTYNKQIEKLETQVINKIIQKVYDGTNGAYYRMNFRRYDGIRQQFLADVDLRLGEIVVSKEAWNHIKSKNKPGNLLINTEVLDRKLVDEYFKKLNEFNNIEDKQNLLNSRGIFEDENARLWADIKRGKVNAADYAEVKQTYAYVLGARSPVQDTGAVPVFKVIGYSTSYAAKVNPYAYTMMGADNDGDTFGMALLQLKHVEGADAPLKPLLATDANYYSFDEKYDEETGVVQNYITEQNKELFGSTKLVKDANGNYVYNMGKVESIDYRFTRNYSGKNTFNARESKSYTQIELYKQLDENIFKDLANKVQKDGLLQLDLNNPEDYKKALLYINVFIRMNNKGSDSNDTFKYTRKKETNDYLNQAKVKQFFEENKENILTLYTIEEGLDNNKFVFGKDITLSDPKMMELYLNNFTDKERSILSDSKLDDYPKLMKRLIKLALNEQAVINTISRIRVSKNGVNYGGNKRKDQMISSHISMYPNINKSKTGYFWKVLGAANNEGEVTMSSLIASLFFKEGYKVKFEDVLKLVNENKSKFKDVNTLKVFIDKESKNNVITNRANKYQFYFQDYDMVLQDVVDMVSKYTEVNKELVKLQDLWSKAEGGVASVQDLINFIQTSSKKNDVIYDVYLNALNNVANKNEYIKDFSIIQEIASQYFNSAKAMKAFFKKGDAEEAAQGYLKQYIIERVSLNNLSNSMTRIIAVAKHDGLDSDPVDKYNAYKAEVDAQTTKKSLRQVIYGTGLEHKIGFSIMVDRHVNKKINIRKEGLNNSSINKEYFNANRPTPVLQTYTDPTSTVININRHINDRGKMVLFGNMGIPDTLINRVINAVKVLNTSLKNPEAINESDKKDLNDAVVFLNLHGIAFYKLVRWILDSRSIVMFIKSGYESQYKDQTLKLNNVSLNNESIRFLYTFLYRLKDNDFKQKFDNKYKDDTLIYNFFNNVTELDETMYYIDDTGNPKSRYQMDYDTSDLDETKELFDDTSVHAARDSVNSFAGADNMKDSIELSENVIDAQVLKANKEALEYTAFDSSSTEFINVLDGIRQEFALLLKIKSTIDDDFLQSQKNIEDNKFKTTLQAKLEHNRVKDYVGYSLIADEVRNITNKYNEFLENEKEAESIRKQLVLAKNELNEAETIIKNIEQYIAYFKEGKNLENKIDEDIKVNEEGERLIKQQALDKALSDNIGAGILLLRDNEGNGLGDSTIRKPKYLMQRDMDNYRNESLLALSNEVTLLKHLVDPNNLEYTLRIQYNFMKQDANNYRFVIVTPPEPIEEDGLYRNILSNIRKYDPRVDDVLFASGKKQLNLIGKIGVELDLVNESIYSDLYFKDMDALKAWQDAGGKVVFNNRVYEKIDPKLVLADNKNLSPTIKQIDVKSFEEFKLIYLQHIKQGTIVGFIDQDQWMKTMEKVYNPYRPAFNLISKMQAIAKYRMRFSIGGIIRNAMDTVLQLFSNALILPKAVESKDFLRVTFLSAGLLELYKKMSDEHTIAIMNIGAHYEDILKQIKSGKPDINIVKNKVELIKEILQSYVDISKTINDSERITLRAKNAEVILKEINKINYSEIKNETNILKQAVSFVANIKFAEFFDMYDNRRINGVLIAGLRVDSRDEDNKVIPWTSMAESKKDFELKRRMVKEISAFMTSSATADYLKKDRFELLPAFFERYRGYEDTTEELDYKDLMKEFERAKKQMDIQVTKNILGPIGRPLIKGFNDIMNHIENSARITNFLYNILIHGKTYSEAKLDSLQRWFNYGSRSPLEQMLMTDIPFFSFSIRSVQNWIDRLVNPRFWRIMSDFIDGWYGQYVDEETKEYDNFMRYQIRQGWLPLDNNFGIRVGFGAFDVMNTIYNLPEALASRRSPLLRAVSTLVEEKDLVKALKQFAAFGVVGRIANLVTGLSDVTLGTGLRPAIAESGLGQILETRTPTIGNIEPSVFYDIKRYEKYIPRRYRYGRNGRYAQYENIYRDWFNKYGRMRRPKVNPYQLVKDIQWRQYVRWRRTRNVVG